MPQASREARELSRAASGCLRTVQASAAAIKAVSSSRIYKKEKSDAGWDDRGPVRMLERDAEGTVVCRLC
jgi:hypothetical protein